MWPHFWHPPLCCGIPFGIPKISTSTESTENPGLLSIAIATAMPRIVSMSDIPCRQQIVWVVTIPEELCRDSITVAMPTKMSEQTGADNPCAFGTSGMGDALCDGWFILVRWFLVIFWRHLPCQKQAGISDRGRSAYQFHRTPTRRDNSQSGKASIARDHHISIDKIDAPARIILDAPLGRT